MGQVLRITHQQEDYAFQLLTNPITAATMELEVRVGETVFTLVRKERSWVPKKAGNEELFELGEAIGKAIALRYRI